MDAVYITPSEPYQLANIPAVGISVEMDRGVDALYVTRLQKERLETEDAQAAGKQYRVDEKLLREKGFEDAIVMHPLPRVDEIACEIDADPRSMYFKQAEYGVPVRMALLAMLLGAKHVDSSGQGGESFAKRPECPVYRSDTGVGCSNRKCVTNQETETRYIKPEFSIVCHDPLTLRCVYCEHEVHPQYIASSKWHQGTAEHKNYYPADGSMLGRIQPENLLIFDSEEAAQAQGFKPGKRAPGA